MDLVAASFAWPFRGDWRPRWIVGLTLVLLMPIAFVPLLGYAVASTRSAWSNSADGIPRWVMSARLLTDGLWVAIAVVVLTAPFAIAINPIATLIGHAHLWQVTDPALSRLYANLAAGFLLHRYSQVF